jgi:hypothetical protein
MIRYKFVEAACPRHAVSPTVAVQLAFDLLIREWGRGSG